MQSVVPEIKRLTIDLLHASASVLGYSPTSATEKMLQTVPDECTCSNCKHL